MKVAEFVASSGMAAVGGKEYANPDIGAMMRDQVASQASYTAGVIAFRSLGGCGSPAPEIAEGIARYLETTASDSSWVDGCELYYATRYSRSQCECLATQIRAIDPGVHAQEFSRDAIPRLVQSNPLLGSQLILQCGIIEY